MSLSATLIEYTVFAVQVAGLPALFVIFLLKGALIGKVLPTSVVLPGYVLAAGTTYAGALFLIFLLTVAHLLGQLAIVLGVRRKGDAFLATLPGTAVNPDDRSLEGIDRWFETHGDLAVFVTNLVPWLRGLIAVPAGTVSYPVGRFTCYVGLSTLLYHTVYVALAITGVAILT